jgi:membrane protease YdiL (CAAX protease family)
VPGLALYAMGRALGVTVAVQTSPADWFWWTVPMLVLRALEAALTEELIVVGYLFTRFRQLGVGTWPTIISSAVLRGSYHLYQGFGPFFGNVAMGVVFGWVYSRWGRTMPLVIAHWILDVVSFVGDPLAVAWWPELFAPPAD